MSVTFRELGRTGVELYPIGLGAMPLSIQGKPPEPQAKEVIAAAVAAGMNFIDTADAYCLDERDVGHNERLINESLSGRSAKVYVATKGGCVRPKGRWETNGDPGHLRRACEASLKQLGSDRIFLYQLHAVDSKVPIERSVAELFKLQIEGKIEHVGLSNVHPQQLAQVLRIGRVESVQNRFNPFEQRPWHSGLIELCRAESITFISHSPMGGFHDHKQRSSASVLQDIGARHGRSPYAIMLAWQLAKAPHIIPIPGASRVASVRDSAAAADIHLSSDEVEQIDRLGEGR